jgi:hypothetical protein
MAIVLHPVAKYQVMAQEAVGAATGKEGVSRESHSRAINRREQGHLVFRVAGRMENLKLEFLPLEGVPITERPIDLNRFAQNAAEVVTARVLKNVHHILVTPDLGSVVPD